ncbi:MAG TPA: hypothetical protein VGP79_12150 [Bryobacteraceae bacterium]|jgi:hypothetical protein|nr:hypothetical protein [Bryobacteraceae bacterium]
MLPSPGLSASSRWPSWDPDRIAKAALLAVFALLVAITWQKWGSLFVDCGREMFIPSAIAQGKRLYFDLWYPYGPLVPYWHSILFRIFGAHLEILYASGLTIVATLSLVLYSLSRIFLPVSWSFVSSFTFLGVALQLSIFNYALPYSYPGAYSVLLIVTLVRLLAIDPFAISPGRLALCGLLAGATMLTKSEFGVAALAVLLFSIAVRGIAAASAPESIRSIARDFLYALPGPLAAAGIYAWLISRSSADFIFGDNIPLLSTSYFVSAFGARWNQMLGLSSSPSVLLPSAASGIFNFALVAAALALCSTSRFPWLAWAALTGVVSGINLLARTNFLKIESLRPFADRTLSSFFFNRGMIWISVLALVGSAMVWIRTRQISKQTAALMILAAAAVATALRVFTGISLFGYAVFYGALPFVAWLAVLYRVTQRWRLARSVALAFALTVCASMAASTWMSFVPSQPRARIAHPRGSISIDAQSAAAFQELLAFLEGVRAREEKFVVWPEEAAVYYFSGALPPNRWYILTPGILPPGSKTVEYLADLDRQNVRYVVLSNRLTPEYGTLKFGADYNQQPYQWLLENYKPIRTIGAFERVAEPAPWGVMIYERKRR